MCWTSYNTPVKQIADENILCYKIFDKKNIKWNKNKVKELISLCANYLYTSYSLNFKVDIDYSWSDTLNNWCINEGYHSFSSVKKATEYSNDDCFIIECIISKDIVFYVNSLSEIVSSNIIVTDKIVG